MAKIEEKLWDILKELRQITQSDSRLPDGDYIENGLVHCGKCKEPKEAIVTFFGKVPCMCKCESEKYVQEQQKQKDNARQIELRNKR